MDNQVKNVFCDNARANSEIREFNISLLFKNYKFQDAGCYSTSGTLVKTLFKKKYALVFGERCNVSGKKATKYFSLVKTFETKEEMNFEFDKLTQELKQIKNNSSLQ